MSASAQDDLERAATTEEDAARDAAENALRAELAEAKQRIQQLDAENGRLRSELANLRAKWAKQIGDHASSRLRDALRE